jgi:hypothetical protein
MEVEQTGWVSDETYDELETIELTLTSSEIDSICSEIETSMFEN